MVETARLFQTPNTPGSITQAQVDQLEVGFQQWLTALQSNVTAQVFAENFPLLGDALSEAAAGGAAQLHHLLAARDALKSGLNTLSGSATYTEAQVESALRNALYSSGASSASVNLETTNPNDVRLFVLTGNPLAPLTTQLDAGLGLPGLGLDTGGNLQAALTYRIELAVGLDAQGFYIGTASPASRVDINFNFTTPGLEATAFLARLRFRMRDGLAQGGSTSFAGSFGITLRDVSGGDNRLRAPELNGDIIDAVVSGRAFVNVRLESDLDTASLPSIGADFRIDWSFSNSALTPGDANETFGFRPTVGFYRVSLDLGTFFTEFAQPVLDKVRDVSAPVKPVLDALKTEVPLFRSLEAETGQNIPTNLLEYLQARGVITQEDVDRVNLLDAIIDLANSVPADGGGARIDLGDFDLGASDPRLPSFVLSSVNENIVRNAVAAIQQSPLLQPFIDEVDALPARRMRSGWIIFSEVRVWTR